MGRLLIPRADEFAKSVLAGADILAADVVPSEAGALRIHVAVDAAAVLSMKVTKGGVAKTVKLNSGVALGVDELHTLVVSARPNRSYNFSLSAPADVVDLLIDEVAGAEL